MKFKEIKPGMVIHCPKEKDAKVLLEHLAYLSYGIPSDLVDGEDDICYFVGGIGQNYAITSNTAEAYYRAGYKITEFSDLIEPGEPQMSAVEVLEWFREYGNDNELLYKMFDGDIGFYAILKNHISRDIIKRITAYEAAKKEPKPVEVEWVDVVRIAKHEADSWHYVHEEIIYPKDHTAEEIARTVLKEYVSKHDGYYHAFADRICRVKESSNE